MVEWGLHALHNTYLVSRYSISGSNSYDFTDILDFLLLVNLKLTGGLDNAFHVEPTIGLSILWAFGKYQLNI